MVKVIAKRNCKFGHEGTEYVFSIGEEREINVPIEKIDTNSFEINEPSRINRKVKEEIKKENEDDE